ncbi:MAG: hypothetical protein JO004_10205 [Methylobacteriaceae bacterium]|nr:hypothetical protein [Methylobacteriaceae bacterium]
MDITVKRSIAENQWTLEDLLGRAMGVITEDPPKHFTIEPGGQAIETMAGLRHGPYASLDAALTEIETHTRGVCRTEEEQQ